MFDENYNMELRHGQLQKAWQKHSRPLRCGASGE
jgi:hypothetical protein